MKYIYLYLIYLCALLPPTAFTAEPSLEDEKLEVKIGEPFTIASAPPTFSFPTLNQFDKEKLMLAVWSAADDWLKEKDLRQTLIYTQDGGRTWGKPILKNGSESGGHSFIRRKDGACLWLGFFTYQTSDARAVSCNVGLSDDGNNFRWSKGRVAFPQDVLAWKNNSAFMMFQRSIIELEDGSLLATMFGSFDADVKDGEAKQKYNFHAAQIRFRSLLVRSTDGGINWDYYSTVAFDAKAPSEGYCEPVMVRTAKGDLLCVMRTGSGPNYPLQSCRSSNDGRTWTEPRVLPSYAASVFPDMVLLSNGVLACSFGRSGDHIIFSPDGSGETWTSKTTLYHDTHWPEPVATSGTTCGSTDIREVAPGRLLYVYSFLENAIKPGGLSHMKGVFIDVERKEAP